jgi:hypothetical protein
MSHPTTTAIELYVLSRLRGRNFVEHLLICEACRARFSKEEEAVRLIRSELEAEGTKEGEFSNHGDLVVVQSDPSDQPGFVG